MKKQTMFAVAMTTVFIAACGGGGGGGGGGGESATTPEVTSPVVVTISGTAATGAAISGGAVNAKCMVGSASAKTATDGTFTLSAPGLKAPCLLELTFGSPEQKLHSILAANESYVNITPITEVVSAKAYANGNLKSEFGTIAVNQIQIAANDLPIVVPQINDYLNIRVNSLAIPAGFNPLNNALKPAVGTLTGDAHDAILDRFKNLFTGSLTFQEVVNDALKIPKGLTIASNKTAYDNAILPIVSLHSRFKDALAIAKSTPRFLLATPTANLQALHREAQDLVVPKCLNEAVKPILVAAMGGVAGGFVTFMSNGSTFGIEISESGLESSLSLLPRYQMCDFTII